MRTYKIICQRLLERLQEKEKEITDVLVKYETLQMANDEIMRSELLLENIDMQRKYLQGRYTKGISTFLPLNQPLYSLMLQVIIPSLMLECVYYRPPASQIELHSKLFNVFADICKNIELCCVSRNVFFNNYVLKSDIVNFTGKYENAILLKNKLPIDISMIYNGSAVNPIVISSSARLDMAVRDVINARIYNSGQDCMAPACIFVEKKIVSAFLRKLTISLKRLKVGDNSQKDTVIGTLIEKESIFAYKKMKEQYVHNIFLEGNVDEEAKIIEPAIFYFDEVEIDVQSIYYAPYFIVMSFDKLENVHKYLQTDFCELYAGYISLYGSELSRLNWHSGKNSLIVLSETTLCDAENGNFEFGGYGKGCNFIYHKGNMKAHPILLLREIQGLVDKC